MVGSWPPDQTSFVIAITIPIREKNVIAANIQIHERGM